MSSSARHPAPPPRDEPRAGARALSKRAAPAPIEPPAGAGLLRAPELPVLDRVPSLSNSAGASVPAAFSWTEEAVATLTELWNAGMTASKIAKALGLNRNQVIGKAHRLKLGGRPSPITRANPNGCRWPLWGSGPPTHRYCGEARAEGCSYCAAHQALAYKPGTSLNEYERTRKSIPRDPAYVLRKAGPLSAGLNLRLGG